MLISEEEQDFLAEAVVVANTPGSLLTWLQRNIIVRRLATESTEDALLDELHRLLRETLRSELCLGMAYAILVAIGIRRRGSSGMVGALPIEPSLLVWALPIWERLSRSDAGVTLIKLPRGLQEAASLRHVHNDSGGQPIRLLDQHGRPIRLSEDQI